MAIAAINVSAVLFLIVWFGNLPRLRLLYVDMAHITFLYGNDETEFSEKLNFVKPPIRRDETGGGTTLR